MSFADINKLFREKGLTLGSVESYTGGLYASNTTSISGASHFFKGSLVTYFTEEKVRLLGISYDVVDKFGVVSYEVAKEMAELGRKKLKVDVCLSFTGNAGPGAMEGKPCGLVYIGIALPNETIVKELQLTGGREEIREKSISFANEVLISKIK